MDKTFSQEQVDFLAATSNRPPAHVIGPMAYAEQEIINNFLTFDPERLMKNYETIGFDLENTLRNPSVGVDARLIEVDKKGRYVIRRYDKARLFERLVNAKVIATPAEIRPVTLKEATSEVFWKLRENLSYEDERYSGGRVSPFEPFTPLFIGPYYRQQYMYRMLEAKSKAFEAYITNPIARRIPNIITQFTLGKGVMAEFKDDQAQKLWDEFAKFNRIGTSRGGIARAGSKLRVWSNMQSVDGESMFQFVDTPEMLKIKSIDTATVLDVVTDPDDIEKVYYFHQQYSCPYNQYAAPGIPTTRYIIRQIPGNEILHVKLNAWDNEKRGRSDLYTIIGWLRRIKDLINASVIKAYFHACYTWDYLVKGDTTKVQAFASMYKRNVPTPGSGFVHNEGVERNLVVPVTNAGSGVEKDFEGLMNMISLGSGIPISYLITSFAASRAGALTETEPSSKMFFERQGIWDETLHEFAERLFRWARDKKGIQIKNTEGEFSFPQINPMSKNDLINALTTVKSNKWFTNKRCMNMVAKEFAVTSFDVESELSAILQESKEVIDRDLEENRHRSLAETKLQIWQSYFSQQGAEEEKRQVGYSPTSIGQQRASVSDVGKGNKTSKTASAGSGTNSGGMSDRDRASIAKGGR